MVSLSKNKTGLDCTKIGTTCQTSPLTTLAFGAALQQINFPKDSLEGITFNQISGSGTIPLEEALATIGLGMEKIEGLLGSLRTHKSTSAAVQSI